MIVFHDPFATFQTREKMMLLNKDCSVVELINCIIYDSIFLNEVAASPMGDTTTVFDGRTTISIG